MYDLLNTLRRPPPDISPQQVSQIARESFGLLGEIVSLGGERDRNFLQHAGNKDVLLKVANLAEPDALLDFQCAALGFILRQDPDLPVQVLIRTLDGKSWASTPASDGITYRIRAFEFLPGLSLGKAPDDPRLMRTLGRTVARLGLALRGFFHPAADHPLAWDIKRIDQLADLVSAIAGRSEQDLVERLLERFARQVKPCLPGLRAQVIHNDLSFHNTVVDPQAPFQISGIFDFGDMIYAPLIQDLAVTAAEAPAGRSDPVARCAEIVSGYHSVTPLEEKEFILLPDLIAARLAQGILLDAWAEQAIAWDDDRDHLAGWPADAVSMLRRIDTMGPAGLTSMLRAACGTASSPGAGPDIPGDFDALWRRRVACLGNAAVVSYDRPLHAVRGEGVWLYDAEDRAFLDAYNNVPHVGHCHPRVVAAVTRQTAILNTNTRYVHEAIVSYAEQLTRTLPEGLDVCYFVSSGSEAIDLAWRLARIWTGNSGGLIVENAYHGMTDAASQLSPSERIGKDNLSAPIAALPVPDDYRGPWKRDIAEHGVRYATHCERVLAQMRDRGHEPAAFFMDMILSTSGIFVPPPGYLKEIFRCVRAAGGLCVADEVQSGFGRLGKHMWGFESGGVVPDIVTFGKPIAGGYPMGLVVTTRAIADRFCQHTEFFSTTGGNPVACAAASAVLQVIADEGLMNHADRVGTELVYGIRQLARRHALIGDVRGSGLFIGVELVKDRATLEPATEETRIVVNALRDDGVLVGIDGTFHNVIKIRPPMVFNSEHTKIFLQSLDQAFGLHRG